MNWTSGYSYRDFWQLPVTVLPFKKNTVTAKDQLGPVLVKMGKLAKKGTWLFYSATFNLL
jgi:hypothetical protein